MSLHSIFSIFLPSIDELDIPLTFDIAYTVDDDTIQASDIIEVDTMFYGRQLGLVVDIVVNPYHGQSGFCAYVIPLDLTQGWTEYLPIEMAVR